MAFTQEDKDKMDGAAVAAEQELDSLDGKGAVAFAVVAVWWKKWYIRAGHKRLARILLQFASKEDSP